MPDFRIGAQVSGLENLRAMAREVLNVNRAFQSAGRQKLAAPAVNISKMTAGLATAAVPVEDFQRRLNRIFATGLVPRGTAEQVRAQTGQIVQSLLQLGNKEAADRVRDLGARLASELDRISTDVEQNAQRMARGLVSMTRGTLTGAGGIVQPLRDMAASVAEEAARLKQSLVPIRTFERELARISAGGQVSPRLAERVNAMVANVQQSLRELGRPDLASAASDLGRNIVRGLERVSPQLRRQSVEIRDSLEEIVDALKQVPADPAIIESLERVRAGLGGFRIDTRAINADAVRKSIESLAQPGETLDAVYRTVSRSIQVLGGELQRLRDEQDAAATAGRQLTDEDRRNVSVLEDQIKSLLSAHQALAPYVNTLSSAEKILRGFNREGRVSSSQISGLGNLARLAEDQFAGVSGEIEQVTADVDLLGNRVERFNRAGTRAFAALRPEVTALRDLLQQVPASISMPEAPQSAQMAEDIAQQLSRIEQSGSVTQGSLEKLSLSLRNLAGVEPELAPALESIASNFDTMAQKLASVSTEVSRRSLPAMQSMGSELAKTAQEAMAAVAPLTQLDNTFKRISRSGRDISSEAVESLRAQAQGLAQERGLPAGVRASLAAQVPILTDTSDLLEAQKNRLREVQMAHRGFASHTGTSAQALLFLQSATQGVMTALALLRGNLMFAGFGLIFMRFTVVRVMLAFTALTFVLGGVMKLWTGFIAGAKGAGAAMQVLRFQMMRQLGSAREVGAFFRAAEVLVRRFGFALDDTTSGLTKMQREGLGPLLANRDLVADFARTFSLSFEQATDTLTSAIGRQRGSLETLGDTMGVIPEIFNKNLDKLNEASRSERAEFVINLLQRYKGAAEDYARTLPGALNRVREAFNGFVRDVTEPFARNVLAPAMNGLANLLNTVSLLVRGLKASEPAQRLWNKFLTNMRTAMQLLVPDTEKFGKTIGVLVVGSLLLALKLAVLLSAALVKLAAFIHLAAGAFRRFLQLIKPVIDQLRALAQMLKSLNLGGQFAKLKNFAVDLADGLLSLGKPSHLAVIGLHAVTLAFADFVKGFVGAGGSALGRRIGRALNPAARAIGQFTDDMARMFGTSADEVAESGLRRWAAAAGRLGKGVVRFFTKDFTDPLGDLLRLRVISKIAKEESDTLIETILKSMTAPGRLAMAPITTPFRILGSSLKAGLMLVIRDIPTMLRAVFTKLNIGLLIAEIFTRSMIEAFVPGKFQGLALIVSDVIFGAISGALAGAAVGSAVFPGVGTVVGAVAGAIIGAIASVALDIFLDDRVKKAFTEGVGKLGSFLKGLLPAQLREALSGISLPSLALPSLTLPDLGPSLGVLSGFLGPLRDLGGATSELLSSFGVLFKGISDFSKGPVLPILIAALGGLARIFKAEIQPVLDFHIVLFRLLAKTVNDVVVIAFEELVDFLSSSLAPALKVLRGLFKVAMAPIIALGEGLAAMVSLVGHLLSGEWGRAWRDFVRLVTTPLRMVERTVSGFMDVITGVFEIGLNNIEAVWDIFRRSLVAIVTNTLDAALGYFKDFPGKVVGYVSELVDAVIDFFKMLARELVGASIIPDLIDDIVGYFAKLPQKLLALLTTAMGKIISAITGAVAAVFTAAVTLGGKIVSGLASGVGNLLTWATGKVAGLIQGMKDKFTDVYNTAVTLGGKVLGGFKSGLGDLGAVIVAALNAAKVAVIGTARKVSSVVTTLSGVGSSLGGAIASGFGSAVKSIKNTLLDAVIGLLKVLNKIPGGFFTKFILGAIGIPNLDTAIKSLEGLKSKALGGLAGGLIKVGEQGEEIVAVPTGSRVLSNQQTRGLMGTLAGNTGAQAPVTFVNTYQIGNVVGQGGMKQLAEIVTEHQMRVFRGTYRRGFVRS